MLRPFVLVLLAGFLLGDPSAGSSTAPPETERILVSGTDAGTALLAVPAVPTLEARGHRGVGGTFGPTFARPGRSAVPACLDALAPSAASRSGATAQRLVSCGLAAWCTATPPPSERS